MFLVVAADDETRSLEVRFTQNGKQIYTDSGTGAHVDLSVFQPSIPLGFFMVGMFAQADHDEAMKGSILLVRPINVDAIATPIRFKQQWNDRGSGGVQDVSFYHVVCPGGYVALGDIINIGYDAPNNLSSYACIKHELVELCQIGHLIWDDSDSGADRDGSIWAVAGSGVTGFFRVSGSHNPPLGDQHCLKSTAIAQVQHPDQTRPCSRKCQGASYTRPYLK